MITGIIGDHIQPAIHSPVVVVVLEFLVAVPVPGEADVPLIFDVIGRAGIHREHLVDVGRLGIEFDVIQNWRCIGYYCSVKIKPTRAVVGVDDHGPVASDIGDEEDLLRFVVGVLGVGHKVSCRVVNVEVQIGVSGEPRVIYVEERMEFRTEQRVVDIEVVCNRLLIIDWPIVDVVVPLGPES